MQTNRFFGPDDPDDPELAIFIMRTADGTHTGILHRMRGVLMIQDVLWHEMFRSAPCHRRPHFVAPPFGRLAWASWSGNPRAAS